MNPLPRRALTVCALGTAQTLAWASSYYLPAMLAAPIARDLGAPSFTVFAAFSLALVVSAALGPQAGRAIDRFGGRPVLMGSNLVFAAGLLALSQAPSVPWLMAAWVVIGLAMGSGLYEAAFATVVRLQGAGARGAITGITLFAGFASTVGWPLTAFLESQVGWRGACMVWAGLHLVLGLPLNALVPRLRQAAAAVTPEPAGGTAAAAPAARRNAVLLAYVFAVTWFISTAMAAHLPGLLHASGVSVLAAVSIAALVGPAQVAGRLLEFGLLRRAPALLSARMAAVAHPLGAAVLLVFGASAAMGFAVLHGLGNGILTIAVGTLPLLLFGPLGYGRRQGLLMVPARLLQAGAPFLFGLLVEGWGPRALWASALLGLSAVGALMCIVVPHGER